MRKILFIGLLAGIGLFSACNRANGAKEEKEENSITSVPVEVTTVHVGDVSSYYTGTATLEAEDEADVVAKVTGVVKEIRVEEGDRVHVGDPLALLDDEMIRIQLAQSEAILHQAETNYERNKALLKRNAVTDKVYQNSKYEYESKKAAFALAELNMRNTEIRAPISGIVTDRKIKLGNMVLSNTAVFRITDFEPLLAVLHIPEKELNQLAVGQPTSLRVDALSGRTFYGRIERVSPVVDPSNGTVKVTIQVDDPTGQLKAGMFCRVNIVYAVHKQTTMIPKEALLRDNSESAVFVVEDSLAFRRVVDLGFTNTTMVEVLKGVSIGDLIVTGGQSSLKDSAKVDIVQP